MSEQGSGLKVKFDPRGRTFTQKDFREMSDQDLFYKVLVFADYLPWKDGGKRRELFASFDLVSGAFKDRENPQEDMSGQNAQAKVKGTGAQDPYIHMGACYIVGNGDIKREPMFLQYREAVMCLNLVEQALDQMPLAKREKDQARKGLQSLHAGVTAAAWAQMDEEEKGFRVDLSNVDTLGKKALEGDVASRGDRPCTS